MTSKFKLSLPAEVKTLILNKALDLFIVVMGITIAYQLNNIKQRYDQRSLEQFYLESINNDLDKDIAEYEEILSELESDHQWARYAVNQLSHSKINSDSMGLVLIHILSLNTFTPNNNTYSTLVNGNGLAAIQDRGVRNQITEHYNLYTGIYRFESVYTQALFKVFDYLGPHCDLTAQKIVDASVLQTPHTANLMLIAQAQLNDGITNYRESLEKAKALKSTLVKLQGNNTVNN